MFTFAASVVEFNSLGLDETIIGYGPVALRWYSLAYLAGILLGWWYMRRLAVRPGSPLSIQHADDFVTWATLGVILGGRLGYVLFYNPAHFLSNPLDVVKLWEGGMSFHGGVVGVVVAIAWFARRRRIDWIRLCDYVACVYPIGHFLGRIANFVNGELWGRPTDGSWGIIFPGAGALPRHPSQLYEAALEGLVLFAVLAYLFWRTRARYYPGLLVGVFALGMGLARFLIEFFREPDAHLGTIALGLSMGQLLTVPLVAVGVFMIVSSRGRFEKREAEMAARINAGSAESAGQTMRE
jgi:phosphatidylglycerol:prolipoprotein diacylglycerol transferase